MTTIIIPSRLALEIPVDAMRQALASIGLTLDGKLTPRREIEAKKVRGDAANHQMHARRGR